MSNIYNFNPGPAALPSEVLQTIQREMLDYQQTGISILETSHRSETFQKLLASTKDKLRKLLGLSQEYQILFLSGGASLQFAMIPLNFLHRGKKAHYVLTGNWSEKAFQEAQIVGQAEICASSHEQNYRFIPREFTCPSESCYLHLTSNNTIYGTQWHQYPIVNNQVPLVVDMSSDFLSRPVEINRFSLVYAGAQKNAGAAGVTIVIVHDKMLQQQQAEHCPRFLRYQTHLDKDSCYNTPPVFAIYSVSLVLDWLQEQGGLAKVAQRNKHKAELVYQTIEQHPQWYLSDIDPKDRSLMNITFRLPSKEMEQSFLEQAKQRGFIGLKGHRSVGGVRVSLYNAVSLSAVESLVAFMAEFVAQKKSTCIEKCK